MRLVRRLGGALLLVVATLLGLVSSLLCLTIVLLPLGLPLLRLTRRLFAVATKLWLPREVTHPLDELGKAVRRRARQIRKQLRGTRAAKGARRVLRKRTRGVLRRLRH